MEELKPCDFCGCDQIQDRERYGEYLGFNKYCRNCSAEGPHAMTYEEAAHKWNTRHTPEGYYLARKPTIIDRGEKMPQTVENWRYLADCYEKAMIKDKAEIIRLKQRINQLEQAERQAGKPDY